MTRPYNSASRLAKSSNAAKQQVAGFPPTPSQLRTIARNKYAKLFGGPAYLDPSPTNRLVVSLRSPNSADVDFALSRLIQVSAEDPDLLRFNDFPGLLEGLLFLLREYLDERTTSREVRHSQGVPFGVWPDVSADAMRRRAVEAGLILRNLALEKNNYKSLIAAKRLGKLMVDVLEEGHTPGLEGELMNELVGYILEVLEITADHFTLKLPQAENSAHASKRAKLAVSANIDTKTLPAVRLFPLLVGYTRSNDRAHVIASFRCLTALAQNDKSEPVLSSLVFSALPEKPFNAPHPIETAIELLPVADLELTIVVLDFMYQHTLSASNAAQFCSRPDLQHVLRLVCTKFHLGARKEKLELIVPVENTETFAYWKNLPKRHTRQQITREYAALVPKVEGAELANLINLEEPARVQTWMRAVYEAHPTAEVTQVSLWMAYRQQFEAEGAVGMLPAAEVIRLSSETFPAAVPMVVEQPERKFVIHGIRVRDRTDMRLIFNCQWKNCASPVGPNSVASLQFHFNQFHANSENLPEKCEWKTCSYRPKSAPELSLHLRTHIPSYHPPPGYGPPEPEAEVVPDPITSIRHERYHAQLDEVGEVAGLGFLSCLVLRNVARTVKLAIEGGASINSLTEGSGSIFEAFSAAAEGSQRSTGGEDYRLEQVLSELDRVDYSTAKKRGKEVLLGLENLLVQTTMEDHGLGKILGEVLSICTLCRTGTAKKETVENVVA